MAKTFIELVKHFEAMGGVKAVNMGRTVDPDTGQTLLRSGYTNLWLDEDGKSIHGDGEVVYKLAQVEFKTAMQPDGTLKIQGYGSTGDLDLDNEIILPSAYKKSLKGFLNPGRMLWMHDWWGVPIGKWDVARVDEKGLYLEGRIFPTTEGKDVQIMAEAGVINKLSVGFKPVLSEFDHDSGVRTHTEVTLLETSPVNMPANPNAIFEVAKQLGLKSLIPNGPKPGQIKRKESTMDPEILKRLDDLQKAIEATSGTVDASAMKLSENIDGLKALEKTMIDMAERVKDNSDSATMKDFDQLANNVKGDFTKLFDENKAIRATMKEGSRDKMVVGDFRALMPNKSFLFDSKGLPMPENHQRAYKLFNLEIDYNKSVDGALLKAMRDLNDLCVITDAYFKGNLKTMGAYNAKGGMYSLECFKALVDVVKQFDPILAKGMGTDVATAGGNWLPTLFSAQVESLFRLQPRLRDMMRPMWSQPSGTSKWPIITGAAQAYLADEASSDNPEVLEKSNFTTNAITFTPRTFATAIPISRELIEDDFTEIVGAIREELVMTQEDGFEDATLNGDSDTAHFDTGRSLTSSSRDVKVAFKGFRSLADDLSNTWDTQSTSLGDGTSAFTAPDIRFNRQKLGILGIDPSQCMHVTGPIAYFKALSFSQVTKANEFGFASTWLSGTLPALDGVEIYISGKFPEDLNASGIMDDSTTDNTAWLTYHKLSFMPSERRGMSLEFQYTPNTQQSIFVATTRRTFKNIRPSGGSLPKPVAVGYNINN